MGWAKGRGGARAGQLGGWEAEEEPTQGRCTYGNQNKELSSQPQEHLVLSFSLGSRGPVAWNASGG